MWTGGQALVNRLLSLVGFVLLGRLLGPEAYGLAALANVFVLFISIFAAAGYSQALVQRESVDEHDLDTIFWIALVTSAALALLLCVAAWPLAAAYDEPELRPILQVLSTTFVCIGLASTHTAVLQRRLDFRGIAMATVVSNFLATVVGVAFAVGGLGVWSLVVQTVLSSALSSAGIIARSGYRPGLRVSLEHFRPLFSSSRHFLGGSVMGFFNQRTDDFLIGSVLGTAALGVYAVAYRVLVVMTEVLATSTRQVAFPVFSRLQGDLPRLTSAYISAIRICGVIAIPAFIFTLGAAPELVRVVFGRQWDDAAPIMQILCLWGAQQAVLQFNAALLQAVGRARLVFRIMLAGTILQVLAFAVAVQFGLVWVAASFVARAYLMAPVGLIAAARHLRTSTWSTVSGLVPPLVASGVMLGAMYALKPALGGSPTVVRLFALGVIAAISYLATLRFADRSIFDEALRAARNVAGRRSGGPAGVHL
jgi:O-antigen/teichoic acid export membrane protein